MKAIDLHVHSTKSDGSYTPTELVDYALEKGLRAFALTDHDTTEGIEEAQARAKELCDQGKAIEVIPGIEFSTEYEGQDIHVLGLDIDYTGESFQNYLTEFQNSRTLRNEKMCQKLTEYGVPITYEKLQELFPGSIITRAHYAKFMMTEGFVKSRQEAFDRYVGDHAPCYLPREKVTPLQAVKLILQCGGIPVLAHPILYHMSDARLDTLVAGLKEAGLIGIEAIYSTYSPSEERQIRKLAAKYDLCISGGSDFHGDNKPGLDLAVGYGKLFVPEDLLDTLRSTKRNLS